MDSFLSQGPVNLPDVLELAHPLAGSPPLAVAPVVLAAVTVALVAVVVTRVRAGAVPEADPEAAPEVAPTAAPEPRWYAGTRALAAALLLFLLVVARLGPQTEPSNLASVVTVNLLWPLVLVLAAVLGTAFWRAADPWRALGAVERLADQPPAASPDDPSPALLRDVRIAAVAAAAWAVFLADHAVRMPPRSLTIALATYTVLLVGGSVAVGRDRWLPAADAVGLVVTWTGRLRRGGLRSWVPPRGAAALLGAVFGGIAFARIRLTAVWGPVAISDHRIGLTRLGEVAAVLLCAALAVAAASWARRRDATGSVEAALVPLVAALAIAAVLRRALVAAQLLPSLVTDPFGRGWALLGDLGLIRDVDVNPGGTAVQQVLAWVVVSAGALAGAWVLARRVKGVRARDPAAFLLYAATAAAVLAVTLQ